MPALASSQHCGNAALICSALLPRRVNYLALQKSAISFALPFFLDAPKTAPDRGGEPSQPDHAKKSHPVDALTSSGKHVPNVLEICCSSHQKAAPTTRVKAESSSRFCLPCFASLRVCAIVAQVCSCVPFTFALLLWFCPSPGVQMVQQMGCCLEGHTVMLAMSSNMISYLSTLLPFLYAPQPFRRR